MVALTTVVSVSDAMGRTLTESESARAQHVIEKLSDAFRAEARCSFMVSEYTHRVKVNGCQVRPPRGPLVDVSSVVDDDGLTVAYRVGHGFLSVNLPSDQFVVVTYTAGYEQVPEEVSRQIADSAARIIGVDERARAGFTQVSETTGPFAQQGTLATWAVGGQAILSPDDVATARRYRPKRPGNVWVGGPPCR